MKLLQITSIFHKLVINKVFLYLLSRYGTYFVQFINSILIAVYLGPYYLGIWGFINMIIQYLAQSNLGISHSVNAIISVHKNDTAYCNKIIGNALSMIMLLMLFITVIFIIFGVFDIPFGVKYHFNSYAIFVCIIAIFGYINTLFSNIFRVCGKLFSIAFNQSITPLLLLITLLIFKKDNLLTALLYANCIAVVCAFILFIVTKPIKLKPRFDYILIKKIQKKGWFLFVYNASFYMINLTNKSVISKYYSVQDFGFFTFSFSLSYAVSLFLESLSYLIFPKLINRFALASSEEAINIITKIRVFYIKTSHLLIHGAIFLFPFCLFFFPEYKISENIFKMIALSVALYTNSFGYQGLLIAKEKEKKLSLIAFVSLCMNIILSIFFIAVIHVKLPYAIVATMITYLLYTFLLCNLTYKSMNHKISYLNIIKEVFPLNIFLPFIISFLSIVFCLPNWMFIIPLLLFLVLNKKDIFELKKMIIRVINNPNLINI